jgi:hypothetical protein
MPPARSLRVPFRFRTGAGPELILGLPEPLDPEPAMTDEQLDKVAGGVETGGNFFSFKCDYDTCPKC